MNMPESNHIPADLGTPTWTQNQRAYKPNPQKGFVVQCNASENFGLANDPETPRMLAALRADMRDLLRGSAVCDTAALCRAMERFYQQIAAGEL